MLGTLLGTPMARIVNGGEVSCGKSDELTAPMLASCGCQTPMARLGRTSATRSAVLRHTWSDASRGTDGVRHVSACDLWRVRWRETDQWTWTSSVGTTHRLHCAALNDNFRSNGVRAFVESSVDLATVRPDHRAAACEFSLGHGGGGKWHDRRRCGYDHNAVQSDKAGARFRAMLQHAPCVDWTVDIDSHLALLNAYILHAARQCFATQCKPKKKAWFSDHSMELVRQKGTAVWVWTDLRRRWQRSSQQRIFPVWRVAQCGKIPIFIMQMHQARMCAMRDIIANEKEVSRLGTELKTSLADDKVQHVHTMVKAAFVERATGDDRAFWRGVRALRARGPAGVRMIALENGELAPTPYAGRQRHFATLLCGEVLSSGDCVAAARHAYNEREHVEPEADYVPTLDEVVARFSRLQNGKAVGQDHLGDELYRTFPHELARLLHPIFSPRLRRGPANHGCGGAALCMCCRRKGRT